ncbi:MAG TPA: GAF domain-containing sensor histidine kinase, partial [Solirubrobacteraceae bacterium]|nr:GAF domain-containing sensor histidine kinase [Solirubrobacteraceae bacterium]
DLTDAQYAALGVLDESKTKLERFITLGVDEKTRREIGAPPTGRGVLGELISHPEPLRLADVEAHPGSYGYPSGHPRMDTFLGVPIIASGIPYGNLYLTNKTAGHPFTSEDEEAVVLLADFAGIAIDYAHRYAGSESRRADLQHTVDALDATTQIARLLAGRTDLDGILEMVATRGRDLVAARILVIELRHGDELVVAAASGEFPRDVVGRRMPIRGTVAETALGSRQLQRLGDDFNLARFTRHGIGQFGIEASDGVIVPLVFRDESYGALIALDRLDGGRFTGEHESLLVAFASSAATAVATAQSVAFERRQQSLSSAEAERRRWARELHDDTLQSLGAMRLALSAARRAPSRDQMIAALDSAIEQVELDIASLHRLISDLRPAVLDEFGLAAGINALADRLTHAGVAVDLYMDLGYERRRSPARLVPELEDGIYRIVQEALTNARKHGHARRASVEIVEGEGTIRLTVRDDGSGFDQTVHASGFGLVGMRERVELLEGWLEIDSAPGRPTTVRAGLPARHRDGVDGHMRLRAGGA